MTPRAMSAVIGDTLTTGALGRTLVIREHTGSTMEDARVFARMGAPHGTTVIALEQRAGRGRLGRPFVSPPGGLYLTVLLAPPSDPAEAWRCGFAAALAARDAVRSVGGPEIEFDWPNDLVQDASKVGGILMELLASGKEGDGASILLLGIGLNLGPDPAALDPAAAGPAGPLAGLPAGDHRATVAAHFLNRLEELHARCASDTGWREILAEMRPFSRALNGGRIAIRTADGRLVEGRGADLREDGAILLETDDGTIVPVRYGERVRP